MMYHYVTIFPHVLTLLLHRIQMVSLAINTLTLCITVPGLSTQLQLLSPASWEINVTAQMFKFL